MSRRLKTGFKATLIISGVVSAISFLGAALLAGVHIPSFGMWFYYWQYGANDTYALVDMYPAHLHEVTRHIIAYLRGQTPYLQIYTYVGGTWRGFFSDIEIRHMVDVLDMSLFSILLRNIFIVLFAISFIPFVLLRHKARNIWGYLFNSWKYVSASVFGLLAVLAILIGINWQRAWIIFHEIFFDNDYWLLNPNVDLLINIVPYPFFFTLSVFMGVFFAASLILMFVAGMLLARRASKL